MLQNATFLLLSQNVVIVSVITAIVGIAVGVFVGGLIVKTVRENKLGATEKIIAEMKSKAEEECKSLKKQAILEAKEQELQLRNEFEKEKREKTAELQKMEQRLNQKDEILNKKDAT